MNLLRKNPDFSPKDFLVLGYKETQYEDASTTGPRANVLILSYNRPRMLKEAIDSVVAQPYQNLLITVLDDASDFDINSLIDSYNPDIIKLSSSPPMSREDRVSSSRLAENINAAIDDFGSDEVVFYLCDDDIMAPYFLSRAMIALQGAPGFHVVQGHSYYFNDGEDWKTESVRGLPVDDPSSVPTMYWSTGSFCHKVFCWREEGVKWYDNEYGHSQDACFISDLWAIHKDYLMIDAPAIYRREHDKSLSSLLGRKDKTGRYLPGFVPPPLTPDMLPEVME